MKCCRVCLLEVEPTRKGMVAAHLDSAGNPCLGEELPYWTCRSGVSERSEERWIKATEAKRERLKKRVATLTLKGWTTPEIARELNIDPRRVQRYRKDTGTAKPKPPRISADEIAKGRELLAQGKSLNETARILGRNVNALRTRLQAAQ